MFVFSINKKNFRPENSISDYKCFSDVDSEEKAHLEIKKLKQIVQKTTTDTKSKFSNLEKTDIKEISRKYKKVKKEFLSSNEMWTFSSKKGPNFGFDSNDVVPQNKVFWKTSKLSFPSTLPEQTTHFVQNQNMLWRSLQHLQKFCEEKYINVQQISEVFSLEFQKVTENNSFRTVGDNFLYKYGEKVAMRKKTRFSQWSFLGHENKSLKMKSSPRRDSKPTHQSVQKTNLLNVLTKCKTFGKDSRFRKKSENGENPSRDEYCKCFLENCTDDPNESPSVEMTKQLRKEKMAPNSEENSQNTFSNNRGWEVKISEKPKSKNNQSNQNLFCPRERSQCEKSVQQRGQLIQEPLRPPVYNPEDYMTSLKKWGKKGSIELQIPQYLSQSTGSLEKFSEELTQRSKRQSFPSTKSSSSVKSGDEKQTKKEKESTLKMEKKDLKNKENINRGLKGDLHKDFLRPILNLSAQSGEMSLRQFSSVTELLQKLKVDLKLSFPSFVQEFVGDPIDGVTLLLELLRAVQLSQSSHPQKCPPQLLRRALLDEHSCLVCLMHCLRCSDASRRLASSPAGLFTLAVCIMSNVTQSRIIALELLTKACEPEAGGHKAVSEALSTLRLRFGEPVRFRFLVGMLSSAGAIELLTAAMKFINVFVESAPNLQQKVYIQAELEQAGFDSKILKKTLPSNSENVKVELNKWEKNYFDVEKLHNAVAEVNILQEKIILLEKKVKILQEEKEILQSLERCLKERCSELEEKVNIKATTTKSSPIKSFRSCGTQQNKKSVEKGESTPAEDEGISSSEQELSQDEDYMKGEILYNNSNDFEQMTNFSKSKSTKQFECEANKYSNKMSGSCAKNLKMVRSNKMKETSVDDGNEIIPLHGEDGEEEETTIDEVIEELENIVNDAETEAYDKEEKLKILSDISLTESLKELGSEEKCQTHAKPCFALIEKSTFEESEIIPTLLHPQPPKKSKSLVHIYFPGSDFDSQDRNKSEFFEDDTDSESSDSLLTTTREKKPLRKTSHKPLEVSDSFNSFSSMNTRSFFIRQEKEPEINSRQYYEEINIDEEEIKRKNWKKNPPPKKENIQSEFLYTKKVEKPQNYERLNENNYDRQAFVQAINKGFAERMSNENPTSQSPKFVPTPVKRSQTFHLSSSNEENPQKKNEVKPKPKMGVSGLDFQRTTEQKIKNEPWKYQFFEYKKNLESLTTKNEIYSKKITKECQKIQCDDTSTPRKGSFNGSQLVINSNQGNDFYLDNPSSAVKSKSVKKISEGLDSLVDIVISTEETKKPKSKTEWNVEVTKNIGPRTRRSLAESSLFCPQYAKNTKLEEPPKPPKPAQRTSLARNNSSSTSFHSPPEVKLTPVQLKKQQQIIYSFGIKPAKSVDSLVATSQGQRFPPDGSSSPVGFKKIQENRKFFEDKSQFQSNAGKQNKMQTFFGNPNFENSSGSDKPINYKYFESNYAAVTSEKPASTTTSNVQRAHNSEQRFKSQILNSDQQKLTSNGSKEPGVKHDQEHSKPNFLLGTYQSHSSSFKPKINGSVLQSINTFNNSCFVNKSNIYSGAKKSGSEYSSYSTKEKNPEIMNISVNCSSAGSVAEKVTDSPSGLY